MQTHALPPTLTARLSVSLKDAIKCPTCPNEYYSANEQESIRDWGFCLSCDKYSFDLDTAEAVAD